MVSVKGSVVEEGKQRANKTQHCIIKVYGIEIKASIYTGCITSPKTHVEDDVLHGSPSKKITSFIHAVFPSVNRIINFFASNGFSVTAAAQDAATSQRIILRKFQAIK